MIITDYSMEEMNGVELINIINEKFNSNGKIKFILITSFLKEYISNMANRELNNAEIHKILEKPIKLKNLKSITSEILCSC